MGVVLRKKGPKFNEVMLTVSFGPSLFIDGFPVVFRELSLAKRILFFDREV